mmetsp:Transcript_50419/g.153324  ORF Transcript_50419/g.153324 Transcript_50419/m.153324 type:complete len:298 (+) Transcript_50419:171-1064(+)
MAHSRTAGSKLFTGMGKGPPTRKTDWMVHGTANAKKTFCTLAPNAFAMAIDVLPCLATHMPENTFGNEVPAAATVKPRMSSEMPNSWCMPSQALTTDQAKIASHVMLMKNDTGYKCCNFGSSMSGMERATNHFTGNCVHSAHSMRPSAKLFASGASTFWRRRFESCCLKAMTQASMTFTLLVNISNVIKLPRCESCWCTCKLKCVWSVGRSQYKMSSSGMISHGASLKPAMLYAGGHLSPAPLSRFCAASFSSGRPACDTELSWSSLGLPVSSRNMGWFTRPPWCQWSATPFFFSPP